MGKGRIQKVQQGLDEAGVEGWLLTDPVDLLYLTGLSLSKGSLWITKGGAHLFVDGRYIEAARRAAPCPVSLEQAMWGEISGRVGFDQSYVTVEVWQGWQRALAEVTWVAKPSPTQPLRNIKEVQEQELLRRAGHLSERGYRAVVPLLKEGVEELEIAWAFEKFCKEHGASRLSFEPIVAFGEHSAYPHYRAGKTRFKKGQMVLIDVGCVVEGYAGDLTRMVFMEDADPALYRLYEIVKRAQDLAIAAVKPGRKMKELDGLVRHEFQKEGVEHLFTHTLGHGVGLEVHEFPRIRGGGAEGEIPLEPGMVFTIEPGLYQPGLGGIRLEETVLVTEGGCEIVTRLPPSTV